jgi:hypothetical protein
VEVLWSIIVFSLYILVQPATMGQIKKNKVLDKSDESG